MICLLSFGGRRRELMRPGYYSEPFFLDEATALAAGHRPCAECRRDAYRRFASCWAKATGEEAGPVRGAHLDRALHAARVDRRRCKVTFQAPLADLPDGTVFTSDGVTFLKWLGRAKPWSLEGYGPEPALSPERDVTVLTPSVTMDVLRSGYVSGVHARRLKLLGEQDSGYHFIHGSINRLG